MKDSELFSYIKHKKDWCVVPGDMSLIKVEYKVEIIDNKLYVLFQQSNEKTDWISNLNFPVKKYDDGLLFHSGFYNQYSIVKKHVIAETQLALERNPDIKEIIVSGWSLGSAIAVIAAEEVYFHTGIKPTVISFGVPKVCFNKYTRDYIRSCCTEIREYCNRNDIVTYMPPIGYWHLNRTNIGDKFSITKIIHPYTYHTNYDEVLGKNGK